MTWLAIPCLAAIAFFVWALHRELGFRGLAPGADAISSGLTGTGSTLVDQAFYCLGCFLIVAGFVLCGTTWAVVPFVLGGVSLVVVCLSRTLWPDMRVHVIASGIAFGSIAAGNSLVAWDRHWWPMLGASALPLVVIGVWKTFDPAKHGSPLEWAAMRVVLGAGVVLLLARLMGYGGF